MGSVARLTLNGTEAEVLLMLRMPVGLAVLGDELLLPDQDQNPLPRAPRASGAPRRFTTMASLTCSPPRLTGRYSLAARSRRWAPKRPPRRCCPVRGCRATHVGRREGRASANRALAARSADTPTPRSTICRCRAAPASAARAITSTRATVLRVQGRLVLHSTQTAQPANVRLRCPRTPERPDSNRMDDVSA